MTGVLDDIDARPGSTVSLLRTVVGLYLRRQGGWMPVAALVLVLQHLGLDRAHRPVAAQLEARHVDLASPEPDMHGLGHVRPRRARILPGGASMPETNPWRKGFDHSTKLLNLKTKFSNPGDARTAGL